MGFDMHCINHHETQPSTLGLPVFKSFSVFSVVSEIKSNVAVPMHAAIKTPTSGSTVDVLKLTLLFTQQNNNA